MQPRGAASSGFEPEARRKIAEGDPWYTCDQFTSCDGIYRHSMALRVAYVQRHLRGLLSADSTVVDIGCGDGYWSQQLLTMQRVQLVGVDYSPLRLDRYRRNVPGAEALLGSCLALPLRDGSADFVMMHQVLEHLPEPSAALSELKRVVKPGGTVLISVPNEGTWLKSLQYRWIEPRVLRTTDHISFFTEPSLRALLEANGLRCRRLDAVGFYFPHTSVSRRIVSRRVLFRLGASSRALCLRCETACLCGAKPNQRSPAPLARGRSPRMGAVAAAPPRRRSARRPQEGNRLSGSSSKGNARRSEVMTPPAERPIPSKGASLARRSGG